MPLSALPDGKPHPTGQITFGDISAILGRQIQPSFSWTDMVAGASPDFLRMGSAMRLNLIAGVAHSPQIHVPHHQIMDGVDVVDSGAYSSARTDLPSVEWSLVTTETAYDDMYGTTAYASAGIDDLTFQAFPDRFWQNEIKGFALKSSSPIADSNLLNVHLKSVQGQVSSTEGYTEYDEQGFHIQFSNFKIGGTGVSYPAEVEVWWRVHNPGDAVNEGIPCRLVLSQKSPPQLYFGNKLIRDATPSENPLGSRGSHSISNSNNSPYVQVTCLGGKMEVRCTGMGQAIVVHLDRLLRADIDENTAGTTWSLKGFSRIPAPGSVYEWKGGSAPCFAPGWVGDINKIELTNSSTETITTAGAETLTKRTVAILEPRTGEVHLIFRKISHATWQMSPARFKPEWSYDSIEQQIAFTPDLITTPWHYTVYTPGDWRETLSGVSWEHGLYPDSTITPTDGAGLTGTETHRFNLEVTCPVVGTYNGDDYARYTIGVQRINSRIEGIHEYNPPNTSNTSTVLLGMGNNPKANLVQSVTNNQTFDINTLQVTNSLNIQIRNFNGRQVDLVNTLGIGGIGNIGVMFRCGYLHQDVALYKGTEWWDTDEPGFSRYVGYCDTFTYSGLTATLSCPDDFDRIRNHQLLVAPLMDGWNHYRAVFTLLEMAGVPESRIGFMDMVPADPNTVTVDDPDYATGGYFLPMGIGANPWTPIYNNIKVGELLAMIQQTTGYVMYCDSMGNYQYEPFLRSTPAGVPKRVFRTRAIMDTNLGLVQYAAERVTFSTRDIRNKIGLLGIDAYGPGALDPILAKFEDSASISSAVGSQPINYVGFPQTYFWIDSRFASYPFALASAERIYDMLRQPTIEVTFQCTGGQPDLAVMDWIVMEHWRSGLTGFPATAVDLPLFVTGVSLSMNQTPQGAVMTTQVTARYLDPELAESLTLTAPVEAPE